MLVTRRNSNAVVLSVYAYEMLKSYMKDAILCHSAI